MEALDALFGRDELRQVLEHLDHLRQAFTLLQEGLQGAKARKVARVCFEDAPVGVDGLFDVAIGGVQIRQSSAVRHLFLALEQQVQALQGLAQLARQVQGFLEPSAGQESAPILGHRGHQTLDPQQRLVELIPFLEDSHQLPDQKGETPSIGGDAGLPLERLDDGVFVPAGQRDPLDSLEGWPSGWIDGDGRLEGLAGCLDVLESLEDELAEGAVKLDRTPARRPLEAVFQVPAKLLPALRLAIEPFESLADPFLLRILGAGPLEGVDGGLGIGQLLLVEGTQPRQDSSPTARVV